MYNYTPIGIYSSKSINDEKIAKKISNLESDDSLFINRIELNTVKTLFQIRNGFKNKKKLTLKNLNNPYSNFHPKERIFIAGKIFPVLNLIFDNNTNEPINATNIKIKTWVSEPWGNKGFYDNKRHNKQYISVDGNKLIILLPISYSGVNFPEIMLDFLTSGPKTSHTIGGEFPDYPTYKLALASKAIPREKWIGQDGCWLASDRTYNTDTWRRGYSYIIKNKIKGRLAPFKQIYDFYNSVHWNLRNRFGHQVKWCLGAKTLVEALASSPIEMGGLEDGSSVLPDDIETILNELNLGICDFAIAQFYELIYGKYSDKPLIGDKAYEWDVSFIIHEQQIVAPPIYSKTNYKTIKRYQAMADKDVHNFSSFPISSALGLGSLVLNSVIPAFDDFNPPAKVTDDVFRTDLPLLMLYLDKHKPKWKGFANKLMADGTLKEEVKKIIRPYTL